MGQGTNSESPQAPQARWNRQATGNLSGEPTYDNARDRARECHSEKTTAVSFYGTGHKKVKTFHTGRSWLNLTRPTRFNQLLLLSVAEQGARAEPFWAKQRPPRPSPISCPLTALTTVQSGRTRFKVFERGKTVITRERSIAE